MPRTTCCVPGCCKRGGYGFPASIELRKEWLQAIQRDGWVPKEASTVCKDHFTRQDYVIEGGMVTEKLKKTAVPSKFWWCTSQSTNSQLGNTNTIKKIGFTPTMKSLPAKKSVSAIGSATSVSLHRLDTSTVSRVSSRDDNEEVEEEEEEYQDEEDEDEFEDAGAILDDSDEEYRGEEEDDDFDDDDEIEDDSPHGDLLEEEEEEIIVHNKPKAKPRPKVKQLNKPVMLNTPKNVGKKRKSVEETEDNILSDSKRTKVDTLPEYSRQLQKAYKEIARLSARCQVLDASLKNKTYVTHRSRTIYQIGKYVLPHQLSFIEAQAMNSSLPPSQRRWSRRMRNICLGLHRHGRHSYAFMSKIFALPTEAELQKWGAQSLVGPAEGDVAANNVSLVEAEALVDEATFDNLMAVFL